MNSLRKIVNEPGLEEFLNCLLVEHDVRNAVLIQPADYNERSSADPKTSKKIAAIHHYFPDLKHSDFDDGILISKQAYTRNDIRSEQDMGRTLGYLCADEFDYIQAHRDDPSVTIEIIVHLMPGGEIDSLQLMANVCRNETTFEQTKDFAQKAETVLKQDPIVGPIIKKVTARKRTNIPVKALLQKLIDNVQLDDEEDYEVRNNIANYLVFNGGGLADYVFDYTNPVQRGILIALLTYCENAPVSAFFPLKEHPEHRTVEKITKKWDGELVRIFDRISAKKGGKKTRKAQRLQKL